MRWDFVFSFEKSSTCHGWKIKSFRVGYYNVRPIAPSLLSCPTQTHHCFSSRVKQAQGSNSSPGMEQQWFGCLLNIQWWCQSFLNQSKRLNQAFSLFFLPASSSSPHLAPDLERARPQTSGEEELQLQLALTMSREENEKVRFTL